MISNQVQAQILLNMKMTYSTLIGEKLKIILFFIVIGKDIFVGM